MEKRKTFKPEEKAKVVLEMLREVKKISEIASEYKVHPIQLHRWKAEAIENLHSLFTRGANEIEKIRKQYYAEKKELTKQIDQLTLEVNWSKKNLLNSTIAAEKHEMVERSRMRENLTYG